MKRTLVIATATVALAALPVASGLALAPYRPAPVDFEMAAPPLGGATAASAPRARSGPRGVVSQSLRAPRRFDLVGLRWRGSAEPSIALRVRRAGERWSRWTPVAGHTDGAPDPDRGEPATAGVSTPVWAGEAEFVQYRLSEPVPGLRLHFVNTTGTATLARRARTAVARAAGAATLAVAGLVTARAQEPQPPIVPRAAWGADDCQPRDVPSYGEVRAAFVHHTVTANEYTPEQAPAAVLAICRYHRNVNGWDDIGYNFVVDRYGAVYEGRAGGVTQAVVGAQAQGYNAQTTGIANLGTHSALPQTEAALDSMARLIRWKLPLHGQPTAGTVAVTSAGGSTNRYPAGAEVLLDRVAGHRDGNQTSCPGDALYGQLPALRARVGAVTPVRPRTRIAASVAPAVVRFPAQARVGGSLRRLTGEPLGGEPVEIQQFAGRAGWRTLAAATTDSTGSFSAPVAAPSKRVLRARYPGTPEVVGSVSRQVVLAVRPAISARRSVARARVGRTPVIEGTIGPAKRRLVVIVERRGGGSVRRVARVVVGAGRGRFRKGFRLRRPGLHRFSVVFAGDAWNLPASAPPLYVRVLRGGRRASALR